MNISREAQKFVWEGAIPLQIHLHESEITTLPTPPPCLVLGRRLGYLPLLIPLLRSHFSNALPPGTDTVWFDYQGLPLKWYVPTGVLFDFLCTEPERPWNLTVHFRGYPSDLLSPCEGEDSVKWSFINSLKEASYIINGNCKNIMNMSQLDQMDLWRFVANGDMEGYIRVSHGLKFGIAGEECVTKRTLCSTPHQKSIERSDVSGLGRTGRIPVRLYVRFLSQDIDDLDKTDAIRNWDEISYINRPVEIYKEESPGKYLTLGDAVKNLLPEFFMDQTSSNENFSKDETEESATSPVSNTNSEVLEKLDSAEGQRARSIPQIQAVRVQGIEPMLDIPFSWVVNNLMNPEFFLHICIFLRISEDEENAR